MKLSLQQEHQRVLQQINDLIEEDFDYLARSLRINYEKMAAIVQDLHRMGLIASRTSRYGLWVRLSARGRKVVNRLLPETLSPAR